MFYNKKLLPIIALTLINYIVFNLITVESRDWVRTNEHRKWKVTKKMSAEDRHFLCCIWPPRGGLMRRNPNGWWGTFVLLQILGGCIAPFYLLEVYYRIKTTLPHDNHSNGNNLITQRCGVNETSMSFLLHESHYGYEWTNKRYYADFKSAVHNDRKHI